MTDRLNNAKVLLEQVRRRLSTPSQMLMRMRAKEHGLPFDEAALLKIIAEEEPKVLALQQRATADADRQRQVQDEQRLIRMEEERHRSELSRQQQDDALSRRERELQLRQKELEIKMQEAQLRRMQSPPQGFGTASDDEDIYSADDL